MPDIGSQMLDMTAVYWEATGLYDNFGNPARSEPVEIACDWQDTLNVASGQRGGTQGFDATVMTDIKLKVGSLMWLGELEDWYGTGSGTYDTELLTVERVTTMSDPRGRVDCYSSGLRRNKDLPSG